MPKQNDAQTKNTTVETDSLVAWMKTQGLDAEQLDNDCHDLANVEATNANNDGMHGQVDFLRRHFGDDRRVKDYLRGVFCIKTDATVPSSQKVVRLKVRLVFRVDDGVDVEEALEDMDYEFMSQTEGAEITGHLIEDWDVKSSA